MPKNNKALSPVIATVILIAVTIAASTAVAAWMGALTWTFTTTEQIRYTAYQWGALDNSISLTVKNTGPSALTIASIQVDGASQSSVSPALGSGYQLAKGASQAFNITHTFTNGEQYNFMFVTARGNQFGP